MHFEPTPYAYQGFRPWKDIIPPVHKPGETDASRNKKFAGTLRVPGMRGGTEFETCAKSEMACVEPGDFQVPDRRGIAKNWMEHASNQSRTKKFLATTTYRANFQAPPQTLQRVGEPEWLTASKQTLVEPMARYPVRSSYQKDFGISVDSMKDKPYLHKNGMATTTLDLNEGTAKQTHHIPGYSGTIPVNRRNEDIVRQSDAAEPRKVASELRLYHKHNMTGYTGHNPTHASNDYGVRLSGCSTLTMSGASAVGMML
uniref:Uncharacterized protein n=1 Tax=Rhizochromulina marina TaxID=1034831 RepID=A0A7S2S8A6_9STRA|mmetsp:Transcript_26477/g.77174  ORF Transcript_26477/g.77174 Transcript_26477/m.77174 type:complete len:257 (+) Transcript_26477:90-860(+)